MTKYLKLSKVTNFLWLGFDAAQKIVVFHNFFFFFSILEKFLERETLTQKCYL